ncbi:AlpA family transcriptional regulator [Yersinia frederiksenii]|uniref:helix-turn-helix transcriptional regulator n=1 Tax=Yersinia frederiksenii TaxID=29484 RepID=UPI0025AAA0CF|nr:AlpA family transcriptional regulator [Yersinia frederiksenii]MDN0120009.1 AlpA family transcriptional regulator [Yersinia frederiksenii]
MANNLIRLPIVMERTGFSEPWIYRLMSQGRFPRPTKLGRRAVAWVESEVDSWIDARIAERDQAQEA